MCVNIFIYFITLALLRITRIFMRVERNFFRIFYNSNSIYKYRKI